MNTPLLPFFDTFHSTLRMKSPYCLTVRIQSPPWAPSLRMTPFLTCQPSFLPLTTQPSRSLPLNSGQTPPSLSFPCSAPDRPPARPSTPARAGRMKRYMGLLLVEKGSAAAPRRRRGNAFQPTADAQHLAGDPGGLLAAQEGD